MFPSMLCVFVFTPIFLVANAQAISLSRTDGNLGAIIIKSEKLITMSELHSLVLGEALRLLRKTRDPRFIGKSKIFADYLTLATRRKYQYELEKLGKLNIKKNVRKRDQLLFQILTSKLEKDKESSHMFWAVEHEIHDAITDLFKENNGKEYFDKVTIFQLEVIQELNSVIKWKESPKNCKKKMINPPLSKAQISLRLCFDFYVAADSLNCWVLFRKYVKEKKCKGLQ